VFAAISYSFPGRITPDIARAIRKITAKAPEPCPASRVEAGFSDIAGPEKHINMLINVIKAVDSRSKRHFCSDQSFISRILVQDFIARQDFLDP
jgi:hypothetical protein